MRNPEEMQLAAGGLSSHASARTAIARVLIALGAVVVLGLIYASTFLQMVEVWLNSVTFRHGLVIIPITAWLVWRARGQLLESPVTPCWWALPGLLVLTATWLLGRLTDVGVVQELAMIAMIPTLVVATLGMEAFKALRFPLLYLFFAVPVGWFLVPPLMHVTAFIAVQGLKWTGIPVFQDGFRISVPTGDFLVANACSGIRYLIACLALGTLFAYLFYRSWWRRLLFMGVAFCVPIIANGLRAYGIILLAYLSDMRIATGFDHVIYGFIFFAFVLFLMFWLGSLFREDLADEPDASYPRASPTEPVSGGVARVGLAAVVAIAVAAAGPVVWTVAQGGEPSAAAHGALFSGRDGWQGPTTISGAWRPLFSGDHREFAGAYRRRGRRVEVFVEAYPYPHQGEAVVSALNSVTDNPHQLIDTDQHRVPGLRVGGSRLSVTQTIVQEADGPRLVWSWYRVAGHSTTNRLVEKLHEVLSVLQGGKGWAHWVSVSTPVDSGLPAAQKELESFLIDNYGDLVACLSPTPVGAACSP